jgi:hypothetical protein
MLVKASSMQIYFREALDASLRQSSITVTETAQVYVVHLLHEFSRSEVAFAGTDYGEKVTVAAMLGRGLAAETPEALSIYRHLGDTCLYLLGFFRESAINRLVSQSYYKDMGAQAYLQAATLARSQNSALFYELSERFNDIVILVENIANYKNNSDSH